MLCKKRIQFLIVAMLLLCCGRAAAAENVLYAPALPAEMEVGRAYGSDVFENTGIKGNASGRFIRNEDDSISIDAAEGKNGGTIYYVLPEPLVCGRYAVDYTIRHTTAQTTARNVMLLRANASSSLIYTTVLSKEGHLTRCQQTVGGTWFDYENDAEVYELRAVLERPSAVSDWKLLLYEKNNTTQEPIFKQTISAETMPQLTEICFENWKLETTDTESLLTVSGFSVSSLPTTEVTAEFLDEAGHVITDLSQSAQPVAAVNMTSQSDFEQKITLRLALQEKQSLLQIAQKTVTLAAGGTCSETISLPDDTVYLPGQNLKLFVWSEELTPQNKAKTLLYSGSLKAAGSGDSLWLELAVPTWLSGVNVTQEAFSVTTPMGAQAAVRQAIYDPIGQKLRLQIDEGEGFGVYTVQSSGLSSAGGAAAEVNGSVKPIWHYHVPLYSPSIQSIELFKDGSLTEGIAADGTYEVSVTVVGLKEGETTAVRLFRQNGTKTIKLGEPNVTGSIESAVAKLSFKGKAGDVIYAVLKP